MRIHYIVGPKAQKQQGEVPSALDIRGGHLYTCGDTCVESRLLSDEVTNELRTGNTRKVLKKLAFIAFTV